MKRLLFLLIATGALGFACVPPEDLPDGGSADGGTSDGGVPEDGLTEAERLDPEERAFFGLVNAYRQQNGVAAFQGVSISLTRAAQFHSDDMAQEDVFSHTLSDGTTWSQNLTHFGYTGGTRAENIAAGNATAEATFTQWKNSAGHNANMLNGDYRVIGIGRAHDAASTYGWYWTTTFGGQVDAVFEQ